MYPPDRRASAIGIVVWGATIGAVVGPNLVGAGRSLATSARPARARRRLPRPDGLRRGGRDPLVRRCSGPTRTSSPTTSSRRDRGAPTRSTAVSLAGGAAGGRNVPVAIVALVTGQVVMVLIMTMTPLHMTDHGHDLGAVGLVISGHTFGMFGLSPLSGPPDRSVRERAGHPRRPRRHRRRRRSWRPRRRPTAA